MLCVCVCVCVHKRTTTHQSTFAFLRVGKLNSGELRVRLNLYIRTYIHGVYREGERDKLHILTQLIPPIFQHIHVRMCAHTHVCTNAHTHVCTNAHTHTNVQTHAHTHIHVGLRYTRSLPRITQHKYWTYESCSLTCSLTGTMSGRQNAAKASLTN